MNPTRPTSRLQRKDAFTILELLVSIAIIAVLAGMLLVALQSMRLNARILDTSNRVEKLMNIFLSLGAGQTGCAEYLQRTVIKEGVLGFTRTSSGLPALDTTTTPASAWLAYDSPSAAPCWRLRFPWGLPRTYFDSTGTATKRDPLPLGMNGANPRLSADFLNQPELLGSRDQTRFPSYLDAYATDRSSKAPWNDSWGNPMVVACIFFQYGLIGSDPDPLPGNSDATTLNTTFVQQARKILETYQYNRSITLVIGSPGPTLEQSLRADFSTTPTGTLDDLWTQITLATNVNSSGTQLWRVDYSSNPGYNAFQNPPWKGIRRGNRGTSTCLVSTPRELK